VTVPSTDVAASLSFYTTLGLTPIVKTDHYARFVCPDGEATLSVEAVERIAVGETPVIYFECDELDRTVDDLKAAGLVFESDPVDQSWLWREARLKDPDGNELCLYYAGENRLNPPWRLPTKPGPVT
jgi:catechol 2,3-dioxygenase-like lactoylglutathione lyase family enzyme